MDRAAGAEVLAPAGFAEVLRDLRLARGSSQATVATRAGLDRSYVNRLEAGERGAPAAPTVEALASALDLSAVETDRLFAAAGLLPPSLRSLGPADPTLLLVAQRLIDPALSADARAALRVTLDFIARHWSDRGAEGGPP
jgi:transcriptional regulator with XRE-family HTH domain